MDERWAHWWLRTAMRSTYDDGLLTRLQELPGFDNQSFVQADGCQSGSRVGAVASMTGGARVPH